MGIIFYEGQLLFDSGQLAMSTDCCCDVGLTCLLPCLGGSGQVLELVLPSSDATAVVSGLITGTCQPNPCSNLNRTYNLSGACPVFSEPVSVAACGAVIDVARFSFFYEANGPNCDLILLFELIDLPGGQFTSWQWVKIIPNPPSPFNFSGDTLTVRNDLIPTAWCGEKNGGSQVVVNFL